MAPSVGTLIHFNFRARGEPPRLVAAYAGLNLSQEIFTMNEWGQYKQRMPKGQVPVLSLPDGTLMPRAHTGCQGASCTVADPQQEHDELSS